MGNYPKPAKKPRKDGLTKRLERKAERDEAKKNLTLRADLPSRALVGVGGALLHPAGVLSLQQGVSSYGLDQV